MAYGRDTKYFTIRIHHGGKVTDSTPWEYIRGKVSYLDYCNANYFNLAHLSAAIVGLRYHRKTIVYSYYRHPKKHNTVELLPLLEPSHLRALPDFVGEYRIFDVYCEHVTPFEADERLKEDQGKCHHRGDCFRDTHASQPCEKKNTTVQTGDHLIEWKDADHEFLELLERPFRKSFGRSEVEASGQIPQSQKITDGEGKVDSISVASHPASGVANYCKSLIGPFNHNGVIFSSGSGVVAFATGPSQYHNSAGQHGIHFHANVADEEVVSPRNRTNYGACNFLGTNRPNEDVVVVDASDDDHLHEAVHEAGQYATCTGGVDETKRVRYIVAEGPEKHASCPEVYQRVETIIRHHGTVGVDSPDIVLQTWIMCSDCAEMNICLLRLDNDAERDSSTYDQSGSSTNPKAESVVASREGPPSGETVPAKSSKSSNGRVYPRPKRVFKDKGPEEVTDMWEDNANLELHSDPMNDDEAASHQGRYTNFKSTDGVSEFWLHQKFDSKNDFKNAVKTYSILSGRPVTMYTNDGALLRATCSGGCKWFVYVKKISHDGSNFFVVHPMRDIHTVCTLDKKNKKKCVHDDFDAEIGNSVAYKARSMARESIIKSNAADHYKLIFNHK
ncbi:OLC1v1036798C1 [Oldenlandia corymbosa var. corymbosa]|uniref:OLC1v1036798C1 n=1 Tax=Oldenlandia corymbosa var. corymbosa TaxID=529605 RepID=A0AAV1CXI3_OLDCO|nr:OLC1v1036798C1 [Oldenlandia corymbosa var. corymbosa]